jgi:hypothetical protein
MKNPCLDAALRALTDAGVRDVAQVHGGKHLQLRWKVNGHALRVYTIPVTPSDWRSEHNTRADVRRLLREDGVGVAETPEPATAPARKPDRISELEQRVARLEEAMRTIERNGNGRANEA